MQSGVRVDLVIWRGKWFLKEPLWKSVDDCGMWKRRKNPREEKDPPLHETNPQGWGTLPFGSFNNLKTLLNTLGLFR